MRKFFPSWHLSSNLSTASEEDINRSIEAYEWWAEWFGGGLVFVGVAATVAIAISHPSYDSFFERWGSALADSLVAIGVAAEVLFGQRARLRQAEIKRRSDELIAVVTKDASDARERTAQLEKLTAWRRVEDPLKEAIVSAFRSIAQDISISIDYENGDAEAFYYASQFATIFSTLGCKNIPFMANSHIGNTVFGVHIRVFSSIYSDELVIACDRAFGLKLKVEKPEQNHIASQKASDLYFYIGPKHPPSFDWMKKV